MTYRVEAVVNIGDVNVVILSLVRSGELDGGSAGTSASTSDFQLSATNVEPIDLISDDHRSSKGILTEHHQRSGHREVQASRNGGGTLRSEDRWGA